MQLDLIEKLEDESLVEIHVARLLAGPRPRLVTARKLKRQTASIPGFVERLGQELGSFACPGHPSLLRPIGLFSAGEDVWWLSERTLGFDLSTVLARLSSREVRITPLRSLQIGLDLMTGLGVLHEAGLVFGGITPRDVVVDLEGETRLDGIGFERALMETKELRAKLRRSRLEHLAPEAAQGRKPEVTGDVFSAAAIVYHLLTGQPPLGNQPGVSTRHQAVKAPSKLERALPYACDAVFVKALGTSPRLRHDSGGALANAVKSLRRSLVSGADEGRAGVADFIANLYPNEAQVMGMPGTLERPRRGDELALTPMGQIDLDFPAGGAGLPGPVEIFTPEEPEEPEVATDVVSMGQLRRDSGGGLGFPEKAEPVEAPDLGFPATAEPLESAPADATTVIPHPAGSSADWDGPGEPTPAIQGLRPPGQDEEPLDFGADTEVLPVAAVHDTDQLPAAAVQQPKGRSRTDTAGHASDLPPWKRTPFLVAAGLLLLAVIGLVVAFGDLFGGGTKVGPIGPPSDQTSMVGFLSIETDRPARVTLDGELLDGKTPIRRKLVRAGRHRLLVKQGSGQVLMDEMVEVPAGEHKELRLVTPAMPALDEGGGSDPAPQPETITAPPVAPEPARVVKKKPPRKPLKKKTHPRKRVTKKQKRRIQ